MESDIPFYGTVLQFGVLQRTTYFGFQQIPGQDSVSDEIHFKILMKGGIKMKKEGRYAKKYQRSLNYKVLVLLLAGILMCTIAVEGTLAWLIDRSETVTNTFTYGDVNIDLEESDTNRDDDDDPDTNEYEMTPGESIDKDPTLTVFADSKACWLYVKMVKSDNFDDFMEYEMSDGWMQLKDANGVDVEGVFYRQVPEGNGVDDMVFEVIKDDTVYVKESVTKEMLNALDPEGEDANYPTLTVVGYAVQYSGFEPEVSEGATEPTAAQIDAAAAKAWLQVEN
jgi:hypothetical protein